MARRKKRNPKPNLKLNINFADGIFGDPKVLAEAEVQNIIVRLVNGDYDKGLEVLHSSKKKELYKLYAFRGNDEMRFIFTIIEIPDGYHLVALDWTFHYHNCKFLRPRVLSHYILKEFGHLLEPQAAAAAGAHDAASAEDEADEDLRFIAAPDALDHLPVPEKELQPEDLKITPLEFYNHQFISFTDEQNRVLQLPLPAALLGTAGSGKTFLSLEEITRKAKGYIEYCETSQTAAAAEEPHKYRILYVTKSPGLAEEVKSEWQQKTISNNHLIEVHFYSHEELLKQLRPELKDQVFLNPQQIKKLCQDIISQKQQDLRNSLKIAAKGEAKKEIEEKLALLDDLPPEILYQEFRIISGFASADPREVKYLQDDFGKKNTIFIQPWQRALIYELYNQFQPFQEEILDFVDLPTDNKYNFVVVDEAQDASLKILRFYFELSEKYNPLHRRQENNILFCFDPNQRLFDFQSIEHYLITMLAINNIGNLKQNLRCSHDVVQAANVVLDLKSKCIPKAYGALRPTKTMVADENIHGNVFVLEEKKLKAEDESTNWLLREPKDADFMVIIPDKDDPAEYEKLKAEVSKIYNCDLVLSSEKAKGLQAKVVLLYKFSEDELKKIRKYLATQSIQLLYFVPYLNRWFTAITRSTDMLIIVVDELNIYNRELLNPILEFSNQEFPSKKHLSKQQSTDWEDRVQNLWFSDNKEEAEKFYKKYLAVKYKQTFAEYAKIYLEPEIKTESHDPSPTSGNTPAAAPPSIPAAAVIKKISLPLIPKTEDTGAKFEGDSRKNQLQEFKKVFSSDRFALCLRIYTPTSFLMDADPEIQNLLQNLEENLDVLSNDLLLKPKLLKTFAIEKLYLVQQYWLQAGKKELSDKLSKLYLIIKFAKTEEFATLEELVILAIEEDRLDILQTILELAQNAKIDIPMTKPVKQAILKKKLDAIRIIHEFIDLADITIDEYNVLAYSISSRNSAIVKFFYKIVKNPNAISNGGTALHHAVAKDFTDMFNCLIKLGADINSRDHKNLPVLFIAIIKGNTKILDSLYKKDEASFAALDKYYNIYPAHFAVIRNQPKVIEYFHRKKIDLNVTDPAGKNLAYYAIESKNYDILETLKKCQVNINIPKELAHQLYEEFLKDTKYDEKFFLALREVGYEFDMQAFAKWAIKTQTAEVLTKIQKTFNIDLVTLAIASTKVDSPAKTSSTNIDEEELLVAIHNEQWESVESLLRKYKDKEFLRQENFYAKILGYKTEVTIHALNLIHETIDLATLEFETFNLLGLAIFKEKNDIVDFLCKKIANYANKTYKNISPIEIAIDQGSFHAAQILKDNGLDLACQNSKGLTADCYAATVGETQILNLFKDFWIDKDPQSQEHPAVRAVQWENLTSLEFFRSQNIPLNYAWLGLVAIHTGSEVILKFFKQNGIKFEITEEQMESILTQFLATNASIYSFKALWQAHPFDKKRFVEALIKQKSLDTSLEKFRRAFQLDFKSAVNENGLTPLHIALKEKREDIVKYLIIIGADINAIAYFSKEELLQWLDIPIEQLEKFLHKKYKDKVPDRIDLKAKELADLLNLSGLVDFSQYKSIPTLYKNLPLLPVPMRSTIFKYALSEEKLRNLYNNFTFDELKDLFLLHPADKVLFTEFSLEDGSKARLADALKIHLPQMLPEIKDHVNQQKFLDFPFNQLYFAQPYWLNCGQFDVAATLSKLSALQGIFNNLYKKLVHSLGFILDFERIILHAIQQKESCVKELLSLFLDLKFGFEFDINTQFIRECCSSAILFDNKEVFELLITLGIDFNRNIDTNHPAFMAIRDNKIWVLVFFRENKIKLNLTDNEGNSLVLEALLYKNFAAFELLKAYNVDVGLNKGQKELLYKNYLNELNYKELFQKLSEVRHRIDPYILIQCIIEQYKTNPDKILEVVGFFQENFNICSKSNENGLTALHIAIKNQNIPLVKYILEHGANPDAKTGFNETMAKDWVKDASETVQNRMTELFATKKNENNIMQISPRELMEIYNNSRLRKEFNRVSVGANRYSTFGAKVDNTVVTNSEVDAKSPSPPI